jgi:nitroreductase
MKRPDMIPIERLAEYSDEETTRRASAFYELMRRRRTVRDFSDRPVPREVIEYALRVAGSAPSGANLQPWHFVAVSDPAVKRRIRAAAEEAERRFYGKQGDREWLKAVAPLGTGPDKPFLETAPWLIAVFEQRYGLAAEGRRSRHYYPRESVGIAAGMLLTAFHQAGLGVLTYTPSPMGFLSRILRRPANEKPFLVLVVGHPAEHAQVPVLARKPFEEIATFL